MDSGIGYWEIALRLLLSGVLAGLIGLERESHGRPAGLRTHILVSLGSCMIMLISFYGFIGQANRDPFRLAAQVVSGIGFLGAGTILREGITVKGLTTAASLWVVSGIGLAIGVGSYFLGAIATAFSVITLLLLGPMERKIFDIHTYYLEIETGENPTNLTELTETVTHSGFEMKHFEFEFDELKHRTIIELVITANKNMNPNKILAELAKLKGINRLTLK